MGKIPLKRKGDQKSILHWVTKTPRQTVDVAAAATPGVSPSVNPPATPISSSSGVHVGVSPSPTAGTSSFGTTPFFPLPALAEDEDEEVVEESPSDGGNPTSTSGPTSALTSSHPPVAFSSRQMATFVMTLDSSEDEEEQEVEVLPSNEGSSTSPPRSSDAPKIQPNLQVLLDIGKMNRISEDRDVEVDNLNKKLKDGGSKINGDRWVWRTPKGGSPKYMYWEGNRYTSAETLVKKRLNDSRDNRIENRERKLNRKENEDSSGISSNDDFSDEDMIYITNHPRLDIIMFFSKQTEPFSKDRREELELIRGFLWVASSDLEPTNFFWRYSRLQYKFTYTYWINGNHGRYLSLVPMLRGKMESRKPSLKENLIANGKYEEHRNRQNEYRRGNRRYFTYMPFGVSAIDTTSLLEDDPLSKQFFEENHDISLFTYLGVYTHYLTCEPDIRREHYYDEHSPLYDFVKNGGRLFSGMVKEFESRREAAENETFLQVAAAASQDSGGPFKVLNKKYGTIISSDKLLQAIAAGENNPILRFGDSPIDGNPEELSFKAGCDELTQKFKKLQNLPRTSPATSSMTPTTPANPKDEKTFSVYIAIATRKEEVGKSTPSQIHAKLVGGNPMKVAYYIGKSATKDLKHGIRQGHYNDPNSQLYQAVESGHHIYSVMTISNLTEKEAFDLESFYIFDMSAVAELDPNVNLLNLEYGRIIPTNLLKKALQLGMGLTPVVSFTGNGVNPADKKNLPLNVSSILDITRRFVIAE